MHPSNHFYGHAAVLARYCGLAAPPPIWGTLQHGWNYKTGFSPGPRRERLFKRFVWSTRNLEECRAAGLRRSHAIGSPFSYLPEFDDPSPPQRNATLVYPIHDISTDMRGRRDVEYLSEILEREAGRDVTVCLYFYDYDQDDVRRAYEDRGVRVITHGLSRDADFLGAQLVEILGHDRVVSNSACTALWYGASLGREVEIYGRFFGAEGEVDFAAIQQRYWPEVCNGGVDAATALEMGRYELGADNRRDPADLAEVLGWTGARRAAEPAVRAARRLVDRVKSTR